MTDQDEYVSNYVTQLMERSKTLREIIEIFGPEITSQDADTRESALKRLAEIITKLPDDFLSEVEVALLLEFFLSRIDDSALAGGSVVFGLHHLVVHTKNLPENCELSIYHSVFKEGNVQSWSQLDRQRLFEIFEFMLEHRILGLKSLETDLVLTFMRAVGGERDPRCLVKVFKLFCDVVKNFDLGAFIEDMFETVACYFPIDYKPAEKLDPNNLVTRDALVYGLESCLLAHKLFSLYVFQLVSEKILDDELSSQTKFEICDFLGKACYIFEPTTLLTYLDDYLTAFRTICLNPAERALAYMKDIPIPVKNAIKGIVYCLKKASKNLLDKRYEETNDSLRSMAEISLENIEPFVLQAEMGLYENALSLLQCIAESDAICSSVVLTKVFFWLGLLINADTVNESQNKQEIVAKALPYIPRWIRVAKMANLLKPVDDAIPGFFATFEQIGELATCVSYECAKELLLWKDLPKTEANLKFFIDLLSQVLLHLKTFDEDLTRIDLELRTTIYGFLRAFCEMDVEYYAELIKECVGWGTMEPTSLLAKSVAEIVLISVVNEHSERIFGEMFFSSKLYPISDYDHIPILELFKYNSEKKSDNTVTNFFRRLYLSEYIEKPFVFQMVGLFIDEKLHEETVKTELAILYDLFFFKEVEKPPRSKLFVLQSMKPDLIEQYLDRILKIYASIELKPHKCELTTKLYATICPLYAALLNKRNNWVDVQAKYSDLLKRVLYNPFLVMVSEAKALMVAGRDEGAKKVDELFTYYITSPLGGNDGDSLMNSVYFVASLELLLGFGNSSYSPDLCNYRRTLMWKQRLFCQFVPIYVQNFGGLTPVQESAFIELIPHILFLAKQIPVPQTHELLMLLPILTKALASVDENENKDPGTIQVLFDGLLELLKLAPADKIPIENLKIFLTICNKVLVELDNRIDQKLKALDCLEIIVKRFDKNLLFSYQNFAVKAIAVTTNSKKRVLRQKAAQVRNLWELINV